MKRGAATNPEQLAIYASDLAYLEFSDVEDALAKIGRAKRAEGELALPELGFIIEIAKEFEKSRKALLHAAGRAEAAENYRIAAAREMAEDKANPEEWQKMIDDSAQRLGKFGIDRRRVIDTSPQILNCPHCKADLPLAQNIRFWSPQEMRDLADVMERNQRMADENAAKMKAAQQTEATDEMLLDVGIVA